MEAATGSDGRGRIAWHESCWEAASRVRGLDVERVLLFQVVAILSPALGLERDAGTGGPCSLLGWASLRHAVAEVLDTNTRAHPLSKLETGPLLSYIVNNVL